MPRLPAGSTATLVKLYSPSASAGSGVTDQLPSASTSAEPIFSPLANISTVEPGSAVPLRVGVLSSVTPFWAIAPWMVPMSSRTSLISDWPGARVSTISSKPGDGRLSLPAGSFSTMTMVCSPSASGVSGVNSHLPSLPTTASPITLSPSLTMIVLPGVPVPLKVGVVSSVEPPFLIGPCTSPVLSSTSPS